MSNTIKVIVVGIIVVLIIILIYPISDPDEPETFSYKIVATYPHDTDAFTQGLDLDFVTHDLLDLLAPIVSFS